jgi:hypothetical protein
MIRLAAIHSLSLMIAFGFSGCATAPPPTAFDKHVMLLAAGFEMHEADTAEKIERLKALPQEQFYRHEINGKLYYLYADFAHCKCLFKGDQHTYAQYQQDAKEREEEYVENLYEQQGKDEDFPEDWAGVGSLVDTWDD